MVSSLTKIALQAVAANITELDERHLKSLPVALLFELWTLVQEGSHCSLREIKRWGYFFKLLIDEHNVKTSKWPTLSMWRMQANFMATDSVSLLKTLEPAISPNFDFLTHLRLSDGVTCEVRDIVGLTALVNLGILEIIQPANSPEFPRTSDSVLREWAAVEKPFPVLRVLRIFGEHFTTYKSLRYLDVFPSLALYHVAGLRSDWPSKVIAPPPLIFDRHLRPKGMLSFLCTTAARFGGSLQGRTLDDRFMITNAQIKSIVESHNCLVEEHSFKELEEQSITPLSTTQLGQVRAESLGSSPSSILSYLAFCLAGEACRDEDYRIQNIEAMSETRRHAGHLILPLRPIALLKSTSGSGPLYASSSGEDRFECYCTIVRPAYSRARETDDKNDQAATSKSRTNSVSRKRRLSKGEHTPSLRKRKSQIPLSDFFQPA